MLVLQPPIAQLVEQRTLNPRVLGSSPSGRTNDKTLTILVSVLSLFYMLESWAGIEPAHGGFADRSVTTSPPGQSVTL